MDRLRRHRSRWALEDARALQDARALEDARALLEVPELADEATIGRAASEP